MTGLNKIIDSVERTVNDQIDQATGGSSGTSSTATATTSAYAPPTAQAEQAPQRSYADLLAAIPADHVYHLLAQADAERIVGTDVSIVDDEVDECSYTSMQVSRTRPADAVADVTLRAGSDEPVSGIGDVAFYTAESLCGEGLDGRIQFAAHGVAYDVLVLGSSDGGVAVTDGVRAAAIEAARTILSNL
jgi:hypothetical protein